MRSLTLLPVPAAVTAQFPATPNVVAVQGGPPGASVGASTGTAPMGAVPTSAYSRITALSASSDPEEEEETLSPIQAVRAFQQRDQRDTIPAALRLITDLSAFCESEPRCLAAGAPLVFVEPRITGSAVRESDLAEEIDCVLLPLNDNEEYLVVGLLVPTIPGVLAGGNICFAQRGFDFAFLFSPSLVDNPVVRNSAGPLSQAAIELIGLVNHVGAGVSLNGQLEQPLQPWPIVGYDQSRVSRNAIRPAAGEEGEEMAFARGHKVKLLGLTPELSSLRLPEGVEILLRGFVLINFDPAGNGLPVEELGAALTSNPFEDGGPDFTEILNLARNTDIMAVVQGEAVLEADLRTLTNGVLDTFEFTFAQASCILHTGRRPGFWAAVSTGDIASNFLEALENADIISAVVDPVRPFLEVAGIDGFNIEGLMSLIDDRLPDQSASAQMFAVAPGSSTFFFGLNIQLPFGFTLQLMIGNRDRQPVVDLCLGFNDNEFCPDGSDVLSFILTGAREVFRAAEMWVQVGQRFAADGIRNAQRVARMAFDGVTTQRDNLGRFIVEDIEPAFMGKFAALDQASRSKLTLAGSAANGLGRNFENAAGFLGQNAGNLVQDLSNFAQNGAQKAGNVVQGVGNFAQNAGNNFVQGAQNAGNNFAQGAENFAQNPVNFFGR